MALTIQQTHTLHALLKDQLDTIAEHLHDQNLELLIKCFTMIIGDDEIQDRDYEILSTAVSNDNVIKSIKRVRAMYQTPSDLNLGSEAETLDIKKAIKAFAQTYIKKFQKEYNFNKRLEEIETEKSQLITTYMTSVAERAKEEIDMAYKAKEHRVDSKLDALAKGLIELRETVAELPTVDDVKEGIQQAFTIFRDNHFTPRNEAVNERFDRLESEVVGLKQTVEELPNSDAMTKRFQVEFRRLRDEYLEPRNKAVDARLDGLETRFDGLETKFEGLETKVDELASQVGEIKNQMTEVLSLLRQQQAKPQQQAAAAPSLFGHKQIASL